jgi:hypothetical protein
MEVDGQVHSSGVLPQEKSPLYPLDRRLGGPQSRLSSCGDEKNLTLPEIEPGPSGE